MKNIQRRGKAAFTLVELMAVITIIVILAGLVVGGLGFVTERQAKEKAKVQIALLSKALEEYKLENGVYPASEDSADGRNQSKFLFKALYWDSDNDAQGVAVGSGEGDVDQKIYLADLDPATNKQGWTSGMPSATTKIMDPWGNEYRYRSAFGNASGAGAAPANSNTQNPDFDLWSAGKDSKSNPASRSDKSNNDDIKNF
ncbi:MAG: type II secretion system protein GspG [Verrucomicrobiota bacterium]